MDAFTTHRGLVAPLDRDDVDTDQIIPHDFLKSIERTGYGRFLFHEWRTSEDGTPDPAFVLNQPAYQGASILVTGSNFGCGSSREHAAWALGEFGFRIVIAPSFADMFRSNAFQNGMLPMELQKEVVSLILERALGASGYTLTVDLELCTVGDDSGWVESFSIDDYRRRCLLQGLDDIGLTLQQADRIADYERHRVPEARDCSVRRTDPNLR